jgi:CheY-like chemotaxis protein
MIAGHGLAMAIVLIVDDEPLILMNAINFVEQAGFTALEAANADEAIQILTKRNDIYAVFSDVQMPGSMDGVRLLKVIRDRWPPIRLILTSGKLLPTDTCLPSGSVFIPKPYGFGELRAALG